MISKVAEAFAEELLDMMSATKTAASLPPNLKNVYKGLGATADAAIFNPSYTKNRLEYAKHVEKAEKTLRGPDIPIFNSHKRAVKGLSKLQGAMHESDAIESHGRRVAYAHAGIAGAGAAAAGIAKSLAGRKAARVAAEKAVKRNVAIGGAAAGSVGGAAYYLNKKKSER